MASITGLHGATFSSGTEELLAIWHRTPIIVSASGHRRVGPTLTDSQETFFASFLDNVYMVNGVDSNFRYTGGDWINITTTEDAPIAKYIKLLNNKLYLYNIKIAGTSYASRFWISDLPRNGGVDKYYITWGLETGSNLSQSSGSAIITSTGSAFQSRNIKIGDPFVITTGPNRGEYTVQSIDSETQITLTKDLPNTATNSSFWVGGNWADLRADDGDQGMGMGLASNLLILYKKGTVHAFSDQSLETRQVKNMPGTTSPRSIVDGSDGYCYSYHPSGIWRTKGLEGELISEPIYDVIEGVTTANQDNVVGWEVDRNTIKMFLGDVTLRDGETISKCVAVFDEQTELWSIGSLDKTLTCAISWLRSNSLDVYAGTNDDSVLQLETGTAFDTTGSIPFQLEYHPVFPAGTENLVDFTRVRAYIDNGPEIQILYKLIFKPMYGKEIYWVNDTDWKPMKGSQRGSKSEWHFPDGTRASGVKLKVIESSTRESFLLEKMVIYYSNASNR